MQARTGPARKRRVIVYVDGFNLYFGLRDKGWRRYYWLDLRRLATKLLKTDQELVAVRYFTARISARPADPGKVHRQKTYLEALQTLRDLHLHFGHYLVKSRVCRRCGTAWESPEEKMTDVNIAVQMLEDAQDDAFDTAILVSADSDLTPPVLAVQRRYPDKRVVLALPPKRHSDELCKAATAHFRIGRKKFRDSQLDDRVTKADGYVLARPGHWK